MNIYLKGLVLIVLILFTYQSFSQETNKMQVNSTTINLKGTSSLHDWKMSASLATGAAEFVYTSASETALSSIKSLSFLLQVSDLKSTNSELDKNAYKALKSSKYKNISYKLSSSTISVENGGYLLKSFGKLTVAGVTKSIQMNVHLIITPEGNITCKGSYAFNMSEYNVKPPSFMFGAMKTGNAVTLDFNVVYKKTK